MSLHLPCWLALTAVAGDEIFRLKTDYVGGRNPFFTNEQLQTKILAALKLHGVEAHIKEEDKGHFAAITIEGQQKILRLLAVMTFVR